MKLFRLMFLALCLSTAAYCQNPQRWSATTGDVSLVASGYTVTIQQPATGSVTLTLESVMVYCSVPCAVTQAANGTGATTTAGTVIPLLPTPLTATPPFNLFTASNVGAGTAQGGILHLGAGATPVLCYTTACGNTSNLSLGTGGINTNYSITFGSITGTVNVTFFVRTN